MIQKLRWKFSAIMMTIVTILLVVIFASLYYTTKVNYLQRSMDALHFAVMENPPAQAPPRPRRDALPLLVVEITPQGTVTVVKNQLINVADSEAEALVTLVNERDVKTGTIKERHLRYLRAKRGKSAVVRYVFADIFEEENALHWQLVHAAVIGTAAFALFFLCSLLLAKWATAPVSRAWEQQRQFVADASHELKTPLTVILSNASMLAQSHDQDEKNKLRISHIQAEADRMKQLVESLLTLARSDSCHAAAMHSRLDLSFIVNSSIMAFEPLIFEMGKSITYEIEPLLFINGEEKKLRQMVDILIDNACKYGADGGAISVSLSRTGIKEALLTVANEGTPLKKEGLKHSFQRFYRADSSRSSASGYGLGLSIALSIVKEHEGKIEACSDGSGQNFFTVRLPLIVPENS